MLDMLKVREIIKSAFLEDMPFGDITTDSLIDKNSTCSAKIIAKQDLTLAGIDVAKEVFLLMDDSIDFSKKASDGENIKKGSIIAELKGKTSAVLKAERTALNMLQRMCGIATASRNYYEAVKGSGVRIADTRKTTPGIRILEKYSVLMGGCHNHRFCLSDAVMIKDNHIKACGGIINAVKKARRIISHTMKIEVETENMAQVKEAVEAGADIILLDNMAPGQIKECVNYIGKRAVTEASGNITLENVMLYEKTGVDVISTGALTHSVKSADISLNIQ